MHGAICAALAERLRAESTFDYMFELAPYRPPPAPPKEELLGSERNGYERLSLSTSAA